MAAETPSRYARLRQEYASILRQCARSKLLRDGKRIHARILHSGHLHDRFLGNLLLQMYRECGSLADARAVFDGMALKNEFSWGILISAYVRAGKEQEALDLYRNLVDSSSKIQPDAFIFSSVLAACARLKCLEVGREIHERIVEMGIDQDVGLRNAIVTFYARCGCVDRARQEFDRIARKDVVSWNAMLAANSEAGRFEDAIKIYQDMESAGARPDAFTFASVLDAMGRLGRIDEAERLHSRLHPEIQTDTAIGTAMIKLFANCGEIASARSIFRKIRKRDVLCWNTMISAEAAAGHDREALDLFREMLLVAKPNASTIASVLAASARLGDLSTAAIARVAAVEDELDAEAVVGTALVNLHSRFGELLEARCAFDRIKQRDAISWSAMVAAYAQHGHGGCAMQTFRELCVEGLAIDAVAVTNMLGGCARSGLLAELCELLATMKLDHGMDPGVEHYRCLIAALGRAGRIDEAEDLVANMPFEAESGAWMALLDACKTHGSAIVEGGGGKELLFQSAFPYVAIASIYESNDKL